jgi:hypothetical protein
MAKRSVTFGRISLHTPDKKYASMLTDTPISEETANRERLAIVALKLERGEELSDEERHELARKLLRFASGESAARLFGFKAVRGRQFKTDRNEQLLRDYALRSERGDSSVIYDIADDWQLGDDAVRKVTKGKIRKARREIVEEIQDIIDNLAVKRGLAIEMIAGDIEVHRDRLVRGIEHTGSFAVFVDQDGNEYRIKG